MGSSLFFVGVVRFGWEELPGGGIPYLEGWPMACANTTKADSPLG